MPKVSHPVLTATILVLLVINLVSVCAAKTPEPTPAHSSTASSQDKAKACNEAADKKGLKGDERKTFMQSCLDKAASTSSGTTNVSEQDKAKTCNSLAEKKGLKGADRRSFVKDCMKAANPK